MLSKLLNKVIAFFKGSKSKAMPLNSDGSIRSQPTVMLGDMVGNTRIMAQYQLDKHTQFKVGESYKVGQMIVTLRSSKAEVARIIAAVGARRATKEQALTERAIDIMMMTPEQLMDFKLTEWLSNRQHKHGVISNILGRLHPKGSYLHTIGMKHSPLPPSSIKDSAVSSTNLVIDKVKENGKVKV